MKQPSLIRRLTYRALANLGLVTKKAPFIWPSLYDNVVQWQMANFMDYVNDGFALNSLIYAAIMYKVRSAAQVRLVAYGGDPANPEPLPPNHPLAMLCARPNPYQSFPELHGTVISSLNLSGNAYLYLDREKAKRGVPAAIYPLRPDRVFIIPRDGTIIGYRYRPQNYSTMDAINILPEDLIHIKFPSPGDDFEGMGYGLSPMSPLAQSGDVDNQVTRFLKRLFDRGGVPLGLLKYDIPLEDNEITAIKEKWRAIYGGVDNWGDIGVLPEGATFNKLGMNFEEMGFGKIDERNESRILGPFGVPPILIGTRFGLQRSTYANYETARLAFWEDTMSYELTLQEEEYSYYLQSDDGGFVKWDLSRVPALKQDMPKLIDAAQKLFMMGTPANVAFQVVGLKVPALPAGDIAYLPQNLVPQGIEAVAVDVTNDGAANAVDETRALPPPPIVKKLTAGQPQVDEKAGEREPDFLALAAANFQEDRDEVLKLCQQNKRLAIRQRKSIDWVTLGREILNYLQSTGAAMWRETFVPLIEGTVNDAGTFWGTQLGVQFDVRSLEAEAWFADYTLQFAQPIIDTTAENLQLVIAQGLEEGWSIDTLGNNISSLFGIWATGTTDPDTLAWLGDRSSAYRAEMIARTETIRAFNAGSQQHFMDWGYRQKEWSAAGDTRTRHSHAMANGQVVDIDQPFKVGGYDMMYPGDASMGAPGSEFINCRCALLPVVGGRYDNRTAIEAAAVDEIAFTKTYQAPTGKAGNITEAEALVEAKRITGRDLTLDQLAALTGASRGEQITVSKSNDNLVIYLQRNTAEIDTLMRTLKSEGGVPFIYNGEIGLLQTGKGLGTEMFTNQVAAARQLGMSKLECSANRSSDYNGYYTWPRLGYDGEIPVRTQLAIRSLTAADGEIYNIAKSATSVSDFMTTDVGRAFWKENGDTFKATFDLSDGSRSMEVLSRYAKAKNG